MIGNHKSSICCTSLDCQDHLEGTQTELRTCKGPKLPLSPGTWNHPVPVPNMSRVNKINLRKLNIQQPCKPTPIMLVVLCGHYTTCTNRRKLAEIVVLWGKPSLCETCQMKQHQRKSLKPSKWTGKYLLECHWSSSMVWLLQQFSTHAVSIIWYSPSIASVWFMTFHMTSSPSSFTHQTELVKSRHGGVQDWWAVD